MKIRKTSKLYIGLFLLCLTVIPAIIGIFKTPYDIKAVSAAGRLAAPTLKNLFGTDNLGRDVFSRVMKGTLTTGLAALGIVCIGAFFGILIGALTGYFGGPVDEVVMRINDGLASFPSILLAMVCVAVFGSGTRTVVLVLGVLFIPSFARVVRSEFLREREKDYVKNMRLFGASHARIMFVHILPNARESLFAAITIGINNAILAESGLSYLGLGVQPPKASLGRMMAEGQTYVLKAPWICVFPGLTIIIMMLGISLVTEAFQNTLRSEFTGADKRRFRKLFEMSRAGKNDVVACVGENEKSDGGSEERVPLLEAKHIRVAAGVDNPAIVADDIGITLYPGETLGIVGESGSGKTMTALAITNLLNGRGMADFDGVLINGEPVKKHDIAMVFQEPMTALDPSRKVGKLIAECVVSRDGGRLCAADRKSIARAALEKAGIKKIDRVYNSYPHELSGGQRQRVLIALAIVNEPKVLICDEPTTALDAEVAEQIIKLLSLYIKETGMGLIFISHDIEITRRLCARIMVMKDGRIVEEGRADTVLTEPEADYTKELIRAGVGQDYKKLRKKPVKSKKMIDVRELGVTYGKGRKANRVIDNLDFRVYKGECFGIVGGSGSGKTTILKALSGMLKHEGSVKLGGRLAMVFQDPDSSLDPSFKVGRLLCEIIKLDERKRSRESNGSTERRKRNERIEIAKQALSEVGLDEKHMLRYPHELSGGQRQRVAIAAAIITKPDIILLDEPVTSLDVTLQDKIMVLLCELQSKYGLTYVLISHDGKLIKNMCDKCIAL